MTMLRLQDTGVSAVANLLSHYGLTLTLVPDNTPIPGSYWAESEAGIIRLNVLARMDTPIHSILHEGCHTICMDDDRRSILHTDAGGETDEEDAVCYLQILLADKLAGTDRIRMMQDMDEWGYTFRLGSASRWFHEDADDARAWLIRNRLLTENDEIIFTLRK